MKNYKFAFLPSFFLENVEFENSFKFSPLKIGMKYQTLLSVKK